MESANGTAATIGIGPCIRCLHEAFRTHSFRDTVVVFLIVSIRFPTHIRGDCDAFHSFLQATHAKIHRNTCGGHTVASRSEIDLSHRADTRTCCHTKADLVLTCSRNWRQLHGKVVTTDDVELIALQIVIARHVTLQIIEQRALANLDTVQIRIIRGYGPDVGRSVCIVGSLLADVIIHHFRHRAASVEADTLTRHRIADVLRADEQLFDGIDDCVGYVRGVCSCFGTGKYADALVLCWRRTGAFYAEEHTALMIVVYV